ncbi:MAG: protein-glutamate O-methyltransferase CheR [Candidatus Aquicultor sp.]|nr:protein-glutamate O-methyltransferase CheR [Candidatus Aquicultor sp.]
MVEFDDSPEYSYFVSKIKSLSNIDLSNYKPWQIQRRLAFIMDQAGKHNYREFADMLAADKQKLNEFVDWVTINVSEFYRDQLKFKELQDVILPELLGHKKELRIWSAGCSNGSEPYTLTLILEELMPGKRHTIMGTDLDERILQKARVGCYEERDIRNVPKHLVNRFFKSDGGQAYLSDEIKKRVEFKKHDLLNDKYENDFDLILCRNVVIYFTSEAKDQIYRNFRESLAEQGVLFVGGAESILNAKSLGLQVSRPFFYGKLPDDGGLHVKRVS